MGRLSRTLLCLASASLVFGVSCKGDTNKKKHPQKDDSVDTSADTGDTGDTGVVVPFVPAWWRVNLYFGLRGAVFSDVTYGGTSWFPVMAVVLGNESFPSTRSAKDSCSTYFTILPSQGSAAPSDAYFDWVITPTYLNTDCQNLDPTIFGDDPGPYFETLNWEFAGIEADSSFLRNTDEIGLTGMRNNLFAVNVYLNGMSWSWDEDPALYGVVQELDAKNVVMEGSYLDATELVDLPDGFYILTSIGEWRIE